MAKLVGLIGTGSGRVGNVVLAKGEDGRTIARAYQPQVNNPKSVKQTMQRAKVNLVGQLSSLLPADMLRSLSKGSNRKNRAEFLSRTLKIVSVTSQDGVFSAKINPAELTLSNGIAPMVATAGAPAITINKITVPLTVQAATPLNKYGERVVAIVYKDDSSAIPMGAYFVDVLFDVAGSTDAIIDMPWDLAPENVITLYRVPFEVNESGASIISSRIYATTTEVVAALTRSSVSAVKWGDTFYSGVANFTRSQK